MQAHIFSTPYAGQTIKFSPFTYPDGDLVAVGTGQYYGIVGCGRLHILRLSASGAGWTSLASFDTPEGIFDCAWNELNERQCVVACSDGSVRLFDLNSRDRQPLRVYRSANTGADREASCVSWCCVDKHIFAASSWDRSVTIFDPRYDAPTSRLLGHAERVYGLEWHPRWSSTLASVSGDRSVIVWDARAGGVGHSWTASPPGADLFCVDWAKYDEYQLATGGMDRAVVVWDVRNTRYPAKVLHVDAGPAAPLATHAAPVRRVRYSPHQPGVLASCGYDMNVCFWNAGHVDGHAGLLLSKCDHHTEFVCGLDWSLNQPGLVASASWDQAAVAWKWQHGNPPRVQPVTKRAQTAGA